MHNILLDQAYTMLQNFDIPWAFCGGSAIDLFLNNITRQHSDIDICVFEKDRETLTDHLLTTDWQVYQFLGNGKVRRLHAGDASEPGRNLMCVKAGCQLVDFYPCEGNDIFWYDFHHTGIQQLDYIEFLFNRTQGDQLVIDPELHIARDLKHAILQNSAGYPYLAPEIALLYKAANAEEAAYQQDHDLTYPHLDTEQSAWLLENMKKRYPQGHRWL